MIANNRERQPKRLWSDLGSGEAVRVVECEDEGVEARLVVGQIARALDEGASASELAVLYRTNAQSRVIEDVLRRQDVAYQVIGGPRFYDRAEVRDALAYLQALVNPDDTVAMRRIINTPRRGIGDTTVSRLIAAAQASGRPLRDVLREPEEALPGAAARKAVREFSALLDRLEQTMRSEPVGELLDQVLDDSGYREALRSERTIEARGKLENLDELVGVAREYDARESDEPKDVPGFLQELSLVSDVDGDERDRRGLVTLMTLHSAKGLEFSHVWLIGMEDGVFPHQRAIEEANLEEERRLCYVGMTRAMRSLTLTYCRSRTLFGQRNGNPPSQFLAELDPSAIEVERLRPTGYGASRGGLGLGGVPRTAPTPTSVRTGIAPPPRPIAVTPREEMLLLATGDTVRHKTWGEGIVVQVATAEEVVVNFPTQGEKRLHVAYAPIEKIGA